MSSSTARARVNSWCLGAVATWKCFSPPFGLSEDEIRALQARREDYARRFAEGVRSLLTGNGSYDALILNSLRKVTNEVELNTRPGEPDIGNLVHRIRNLSSVDEGGPKQARKCARCVAEGGCPRYLNDPFPLPSQDADFPPMKGVEGYANIRDHLCMTHFEQLVYRSWQKAYDEQTPMPQTGRPMVFPPKKPASMLPEPRFSHDAEREVAKWIERFTADEIADKEAVGA